MAYEQNFKWALDGDKALMRKLAALAKPSSVRRVMRPSIRAGCSIVNKAAKARAPKRTGALKKSIGVKIKSMRNGTIWGGVGPRLGYEVTMPDGSIHDPAMVGHMVELGHGGPNPAPAHPFLRPALDANRAIAIAKIATKARERLRKEAERK